MKDEMRFPYLAFLPLIYCIVVAVVVNLLKYLIKGG